MDVVVTAGTSMWRMVKRTNSKRYERDHLVWISMYSHTLTLDLPLQASTPSNQLWPTFLLPLPPQFLYQAPPGAQQLDFLDFLNVPQFGHIIITEATPNMMRDVVVGVLAIRHRASHR